MESLNSVSNTFIIAEIAQAHDGSLGILHSYIDALAAQGVDAIKFQTHIAQAESSIHEPFRVPFSYEDDTRYDYWQRMEFSQQEWNDIAVHCQELGVAFWSSPFSNAAVDCLELAGVKGYKIGSGEVTNFLLLEKVIQTGKPIIISSGMSNYAELDQAVDLLKSRNANFSVLQCYTAYPTTPDQYGLQEIFNLKERYQVPVGFSDHSGKCATGIAAVALGAQILEFHAVWDRRMFGPDATSSLTINEIGELVKDIRAINQALNRPVNKEDVTAFAKAKSIFEKSLAVNKSLPKGHLLSFEDLEAKKPSGYGIKASHYQEVLGKALTKDVEAWQFLTENDINGY